MSRSAKQTNIKHNYHSFPPYNTTTPKPSIRSRIAGCLAVVGESIRKGIFQLIIPFLTCLAICLAFAVVLFGAWTMLNTRASRTAAELITVVSEPIVEKPSRLIISILICLAAVILSFAAWTGLYFCAVYTGVILDPTEGSNLPVTERPASPYTAARYVSGSESNELSPEFAELLRSWRFQQTLDMYGPDHVIEVARLGGYNHWDPRTLHATFGP